MPKSSKVKGKSRRAPKLQVCNPRFEMPRSVHAPVGGSLVTLDQKGSETDEKRPPVKQTVFLSNVMNLGFAGYTPLPHVLRTKLRYATGVSLATSASGAVAGVHVFNASSLYDPDFTSTGHQPRGFDQLIELYDHFVVLKSRIKVEFAPSSVTHSICFGIQLNAVTNTKNDWIDYIEQARAEMAVSDYATSGGSCRTERLMLEYDAKEFMGVPDPLSATKLQGSVGANPTDNAFFHLFAQEYSHSVDIVVAAVLVIEFDCAFIEPIAVDAS